MKWIGPNWQPFDQNVKELRALQAECLKRYGKTKPRPYWPVRNQFAGIVALNFSKAYPAVKAYLIAWDRFQARTKAELAQRQREANAGAKGGAKK